MSAGASVLTVDSLMQLHAALARLGVQAGAALDTAAGELRRASDFLEQQRQRWQREAIRQQEELNRARDELSQKRASHDGKRVGTSEAEMAVHKARARLKEAEEKIDLVRRWQRQLPQHAADVQQPARRLAGALEADLRVGLAMLESRAAALESYLAVAPPSGGSMS